MPYSGWSMPIPAASLPWSPLRIPLDVLAARRPEVQALEAWLASWEAPALAEVAGAWLGQTDALLYFRDTARPAAASRPRRRRVP